ncbi:CRTAC1 family protein [Candidatus Woesearchaeota archaeon]|nr:CRTAC1 family protein [Candidatus Woesearchaeota archaeon]
MGAKKRKLGLFVGLILGLFVVWGCENSASEGYLDFAKDDPAKDLYEYLVDFANDEVGKEKKYRVDSVRELKKSILSPLIESFKNKKISGIKRLVSKDFESSSWSDRKLINSDEISSDYSFGDSMLSKDAALDSINQFMESYERIEGMDITILKFDGTSFFGKMSIRGFTEKDSKIESYGDITITLNDEEKIEKIVLDETRTVLPTTENIFVEYTQDSGLNEIPVYLRNEAIRRGGYALSMYDYDRDGFVDMYVGLEGNGILLRNDGNDNFVDVTESAGLENDTLVKAAFFSDLNNDGISDLVIARFEYSPDKQIKIYEGKGDKTFELVSDFKLSGFAKYDYSTPMPMAIGNFNNDEFLDFYLGFPGKLDFSTFDFEKSLLKSKQKEGMPQGLFINLGQFKFEDKTNYSLYQSNKFNENMDPNALFPHAATATDLNHDGYQDLIVIDDRRNPSPILYNNGDGTFVQVSKEIGVDRSAWGMSSPVADFNNDGFQDMFLTSVHFSTNFLLDGLNVSGNRLYQNLGNGKFEDVSQNSPMQYAGESPGAAEFFDFDNDGDLDIYVANGLWSGPINEDIEDIFVMAYENSKLLKKEMSEDLSNAISSVAFNNGQTMMGILKEYQNSEGVPLLSFGGYQRNRLYKNNGDGTFTDISYIIGVDSIYDGYIMATADLERDGDLDLVLRNADPGTPNYKYPPIQLFLNNIGNKKNYLILQLDGTETNKDAIGTKVTISTSSGKQYKELIANSGAAQSEKIIHFGIGDDEIVQKIEIIWPNGKTQSLDNVGSGRYSLMQGGKLVEIA